MQNSNIVVAIMCLDKAGELLQYFYPDVSNTLNALADKLKEENKIDFNDFEEIKKIEEEIKNG